MKLLTTIGYYSLVPKFVSNHWDIHLSGLCYFNSMVCYFKTEDTGYDDIKDDFNEPICKIYKLSIKEKIKWWLDQKKFEWMVGYHWTYPHRSKGVSFYYRKPIWFYKWLFKIFYKLK